jgi:hypothetical protein
MAETGYFLFSIDAAMHKDAAPVEAVDTEACTKTFPEP